MIDEAFTALPYRIEFLPPGSPELQQVQELFALIVSTREQMDDDMAWLAASALSSCLSEFGV